MSRFRLSAPRTSAPGLIGAIAVIACGATAAWWAVQIAAPRQAIAPAVEATLIQPDASAATALFGTAGRPQNGMPDSRLGSVRVVGVVVHTNRGSALIAIDGGPVRAFAVGDTVTAGLTLRQVNADGAVFERFGERIEVAAPRRTAVEVLNRNSGKQ